MKSKYKTDKNGNPVLLKAEKVWNSKLNNAVELGETQFVLRYTEKDKRKDKVFSNETDAIKSFEEVA